MKTLRLLIILLALTAMVWIKPTQCDAQGDWQKRLASRYAGAISGIQQVCIERGKVECELVGIEQDPPLLSEGEVIDYVGVRTRGILYFYLVVAEKDNMDPDIYLFDSFGRLLAQGKEVGPVDLTFHKPEYTQKVIARIKMFKGSGHIALAVLAPVGSD